MSDHEAGRDDAGWDEDGELRDRLRAADPAASLPPADPSRVARLLEDTMNSSTEDEVLTTESRETGTHGRSPLTWLVAAAAIVLIAGVALFGLLRHDSGNDKVPAAGGSPSVTELQAPGPASYQARCMVPTAETISRQTVAFDGTVTGIAGGLVTLRPTHFYAGEATELVKVEAPTADLRALIQAVEFEDGKRYLVSATDGEVSICGLSAPWSQRLAGLYAQAFPS
ncbi:hypothetical protein GCM10009844_03830 [Nocardioides koreensis]|uniref:Uncharacterized protein n=1 Tax=Nocardioides koreensis TaxID=433651 RepID=A0ABN2Z5H5_9ACTN